MRFPAINEENKLNLNLSDEALQVVQGDMAAFHSDSLSGFLNLVFSNFYKDAAASVDLRLQQQRQQLTSLLSGSLDKTALETTVGILQEASLKSWERFYKAYPKQNSLKFRLNKENHDLLIPKNPPTENPFGISLTRYLKTVFEEYARLPFVRREAIYFKESVFAVVEKAIARKQLLEVTTDQGLTYYLRPWKILQDPLATANYLVGLRVDPAAPERPLKEVPFRISAMAGLCLCPEKCPPLTKEQTSALEELVQKRGVQFLLSQEEPIRVRLTEAGIRKYNRLTTLRPACTAIEAPDVYVFCCTPIQAEFYFPRLGADAEILSPPQLRQRVADHFQKAAALYE